MIPFPPGRGKHGDEGSIVKGLKEVIVLKSHGRCMIPLTVTISLKWLESKIKNTYRRAAGLESCVLSGRNVLDQ